MAEEEKPSILAQILHKTGVAQYFQKFKFGGFVGKLCVFGGIAVVVIGAITFRLHSDWMIFGSVITIGGTVVYVVTRVSSFADKHPELAMMEGLEVLRLEHLRLAAKGVQVPLEPGKLIEEHEAKALPEETGGEK